MSEKRILTHLGYTDIFTSFDRHGLLLPTTLLATPADVERQIAALLARMNTVELIQFTSFLNMICQTSGAQTMTLRGIGLLIEAGVVPRQNSLAGRVLFHRENLLNLVGQVLEYDLGGGIEPLTGPGHLMNKQRYCKALLLTNDLLPLHNGQRMSSGESVLRDYCLREWPHYYVPIVARSVYRHRIVRYRHCYEVLQSTLDDSDRAMLATGIKAFEQQVGVSLRQYLTAVRDLYGWFYELPYQKECGTAPPGSEQLGFDYSNIASFYIDRTLFPNNSSLIATLEALASDEVSLRSTVLKERQRIRDPIVGYNRNVRVFFEKPVFKVSERQFCIIDLKFLIESVCGGLQWRIGAGHDLQNFRAAYGHLIELYFRFLLRRIFGESQVRFDDPSGADAIVEFGNTVFVFEFTVEYYRVASLYNPTTKEFVEDVNRILFSPGKDRSSPRPKQDKGKMVKLHKYTKFFEDPGRVVVPILVTENMLGDHELFATFGDVYRKGISAHGLSELLENVPAFLCLDDLEFFWAFFEPDESKAALLEFVQEWRQIGKGPYLHSPSAGLSTFLETKQGRTPVARNQEYLDFMGNGMFDQED